MGCQIYHKEEFIIFHCGDGYIVQNLDKNFKDGHTHLKNFEAAKRVISLVMRKKIPNDSSKYFLESLARVSNDPKYSSECRQLIETKRAKGKKQKFYNETKVQRGK